MGAGLADNVDRGGNRGVKGDSKQGFWPEQKEGWSHCVQIREDWGKKVGDEGDGRELGLGLGRLQVPIRHYGGEVKLTFGY